MLTDDEWDDLIVFELGEDERSESLRSVVERIVTARVRAARAQELRDAADLIAVTKFNDPFGVNREAWKLLRDRADRLDATDQLQDPKD